MLWLNALILFVLFAGHAEILAAAINRLHSCAYHTRILDRFRHVHDALLVVVPVLVLVFVGFRGPRLLAGGSWSDLPVGWAVYFVICGIGALSLALSSLRWHTRTEPRQLRANDARVVDVERQLGFRPAGHGRYKLLPKFPGNEQFQLEVAEKQFELARLPPEWDGVSILHVADLHFSGAIDRPYYDKVIDCAADANADLVVFTGDLLDNMRLLDWAPETLGRLAAPLGCLFILGNHDWYLDQDVIRRAILDLGWQNVAGRTITLQRGAAPLVVGGSELPWMGQHPDFTTSPPDAFRLLLSHTPDNIAWARRNKVDLMLSGHNHGGQVVLPVIGPVYAPSRYGLRYVGGSYFKDPTLLYVSRGIAGERALRWNCRPELTKLVLKSVGVSQ